ncbi:DUF481 domain-containing protein [bacterium]|nr:DUF481 domain-containing protein [bacterium]
MTSKSDPSRGVDLLILLLVWSLFTATPADAIDLDEVAVRADLTPVELVEEDVESSFLTEESGPTPQKRVSEKPVAFIQSVSLFEEDDHRQKGLIHFPHIFGGSKEEPAGNAPPKAGDYVLKPLVEPLGLVKVILDPVKEANKLLPEQLDPFHSTEEQPVTEEEKAVAEELKKAKLRQQQLLLNTGTGSRLDALMGLDSRWHFQVQAGGSFRQGNNPSTNINTQLRAERYTIYSNFVSKLGAFYSEQTGSKPNRRIFGQGTYDRNLRGRWFAYVREDLEWDAIRLINLRAVSSAGLGFKFIDNVRERLLARVGPTASYIDYDRRAQSQDEFRSGWLLEADYRRIMGEASRFELTSSAYPDFDNNQQFRVRTEAALLFPIGKASVWNWKVGVRHEYIMNPVITTKANDIEGYFSIVYTK